jgi:predicted nucleotidyltransferase
MFQYKIIEQLPALFKKEPAVKAALLIGSFGRQKPRLSSDIDLSLWVKEDFEPLQLATLLKQELPEAIYTVVTELRNKIIVYFAKAPKLEIAYSAQLIDLEKNFLGSEIAELENSLLYTITEVKKEVEEYFSYLLQNKSNKPINNNEEACKLTDKFVYEFEKASDLHRRGDSYKSYFCYNIALHVALQLKAIADGRTSFLYLPPNIAHSFGPDEEKSYRALAGTLYLPELNLKKRALLDFFLTTIKRIGAHAEAELSAIENFLEQIYERDFFWNFRDVSALLSPIKPGKFFRSSSLTRYQKEPFFQDWLQKHKINKVVDFRDPDEYQKSPYDEKTLELIEHLNWSIDPRRQSEDFRKKYHYGTPHQIAYRHFAAEHKHVFKAIFEQIDPAKDVFLLHCHAGKDRTGCVVALIALALGVSYPLVLQDFLASEMDVQLSNFTAFMEVINEADGAYQYLLEAGVAPETIAYWKKHLIQENL